MSKKAGIYIAGGVYVARGDGKNFVSCVLVDRDGVLRGVYEKRYPYLKEIETDPNLRAGLHTPIWETEFGKLGAAICFDINFPEVWQDLADTGVDMVIWPSAYSGGSLLGAYAQIHHFHVLSCTQAGDSRLYDPTGAASTWSNGPIPDSRIFDLDLNEGVYHQNFNLDKMDSLLQDYQTAICADEHMDAEQWIVLRSRDRETSARDAARNYGMEELRDYITRSRKVIRDIADK